MPDANTRLERVRYQKIVHDYVDDLICLWFDLYLYEQVQPLMANFVHSLRENVVLKGSLRNCYMYHRMIGSTPPKDCYFDLEGEDSVLDFMSGLLQQHATEDFSRINEDFRKRLADCGFNDVADLSGVRPLV